jgi:hypothetical protein
VVRCHHPSPVFRTDLDRIDRHHGRQEVTEMLVLHPESAMTLASGRLDDLRRSGDASRQGMAVRSRRWRRPARPSWMWSAAWSASTLPG